MEPVFFNKNDRTSITEATAKQVARKQVIDYEVFFRDLKYVNTNSFLLSGEIPQSPTWVLYISVVKQQIHSLLPQVLSLLPTQEAAIIIPENSNIHTMILEGGFGYAKAGKVITILTGANHLQPLAKRLIEVTDAYAGVDVPTAKHLGGCLYTAPDLEYFGPRDLRTPDLQWPFGAIKKEPNHRSPRFLAGKYLITQTLKSDVKGNVFRGIYFKKPFQLDSCLIKQGKVNQCFDDYARTIRERLNWQYLMQSRLSSSIAVPAAYDYFETGYETFLVTEFIEGKSLLDVLAELQEGKSWCTITSQNKLTMLSLIMQCIKIISEFHHDGIIHRDISPMNFMVTHSSQVFAIDIELCYDVNAQQPQPAFNLGTPGYMSPSQSAQAEPCFEDDIYSIGGLLVKALTGLAPTKFSNSDTGFFFRQLMHHIKNERLVLLVHQCLNNNPAERPGLDSIHHTLSVYYSLLLTTSATVASSKPAEASHELLHWTIGKSFEAFWKSPLLGKRQLWYAKPNEEEVHVSNEVKSLSWEADFYNGSAGILFTLNRADHLGFDTAEYEQVFFANYNTALEYYSAPESTINSGLLYGSAGFAVVIAALIKNGLLENTINHYHLINILLNRPNNELNIAHGQAGQGVALLICAEWLNFPNLKAGAATLALNLMKSQLRDGSWEIAKTGSHVKAKVTGLFQGISGIIYFLLANYGANYCERSKAAAVKALDWLGRQRRNSNGHGVWTVNAKSKVVDPWLGNGFTGIAFVFLKAYEVLKVPAYREIATVALLSHPQEIASNYLGQAGGLAGLGEVYLEAYRITSDVQWQERASYLAGQLLHSSKNELDQSLYWLEGSETMPTAGFMNGNSGILHFLLRISQPQKVGFHLFSI